jgi:hypothetical protein
VLQYTFSGSHNHDPKYNYSKAHLNTLQILSEVFTKPKTKNCLHRGKRRFSCKEVLLRTNKQANKQTNKQTYSQAGRQAYKHPEQISVRLDKSCEPMSDLVGAVDVPIIV